jgi:alkanesulfonate monooxygenase SsuD/methylene tetrahydromethanopterin reductase-like flavin-dependent oxidoreductase (luciferase family)
MATPVVVVATEAAAQRVLESLPPERRPYIRAGTPEQAAEVLRPYIEAGFTGFTFNNNVYRTPEDIAVIGELLRLVATEAPVAAR